MCTNVLNFQKKKQLYSSSALLSSCLCPAGSTSQPAAATEDGSDSHHHHQSTSPESPWTPEPPSSGSSHVRCFAWLVRYSWILLFTSVWFPRVRRDDEISWLASRLLPGKPLLLCNRRLVCNRDNYSSALLFSLSETNLRWTRLIFFNSSLDRITWILERSWGYCEVKSNEYLATKFVGTLSNFFF